MALNYEQRVLRVLQHIHENLDGDLSLDSLADIALMSRFHWHRVFQAMTGETCAQAVRRVRLYRAASWLQSKQVSVAEVSHRVGYLNARSFVRAFKEEFGVSPTIFRDSDKMDLPLKIKTRGDFTMFKVELTQVEDRRLAALLHTGAYTEIGECFGRLIDTANAEGLWPRVQGLAAVYYNDPNTIEEKKLRAHAGLIITDSAALPAGLEEVKLSGGRCAVLHYKGPYTAIKVAYDYLYGSWLPQSGQEPADAPPYEIYLNDPAEVAESELLTDIVLPLTQS